MKIVAVYNQTRQTWVAEQVEWADTFWRRARGLLGRRQLEVGMGLALQPCCSIHMLFMQFAIDALYISSTGEVVACVPALRPWAFGPIVRRAGWVLELSVGAIAKSGTEVGDRLSWQEKIAR